MPPQKEIPSSGAGSSTATSSTPSSDSDLISPWELWRALKSGKRIQDDELQPITDYIQIEFDLAQAPSRDLVKDISLFIRGSEIRTHAIDHINLLKFIKQNRKSLKRKRSDDDNRNRMGHLRVEIEKLRFADVQARLHKIEEAMHSANDHVTNILADMLEDLRKQPGHEFYTTLMALVPADTTFNVWASKVGLWQLRDFRTQIHVPFVLQEAGAILHTVQIALNRARHLIINIDLGTLDAQPSFEQEVEHFQEGMTSMVAVMDRVAELIDTPSINLIAFWDGIVDDMALFNPADPIEQYVQSEEDRDDELEGMWDELFMFDYPNHPRDPRAVRLRRMRALLISPWREKLESTILHLKSVRQSLSGCNCL
ncbi:unnamed protein product [Periconia digitata]|uniref:Uncharacterized protein n=1 Tax=Periconia digitata TaxID=1303443 RepID=A0A9W4U4C8_9PLEO|nr:unnamed protein product [Periconia digitata]